MREDMIERLKKIHGGTFFRMKYKVEPTMTAEAKKEFICIEKVVTKTVRTGVCYGNIGFVKNKLGGVQSGSIRTPWYTWDKRNVIAKHNKKDQWYLAVMPMERGTNTVTKWYFNGKEVDEDYVKQSGYVASSYWKSEHVPFYMVNVDNILEVGNV